MKRSREVIISDILDICMLGANKTKIVYQANLNFRTVNPYLDMLMEKGLIDLSEGRKNMYVTTDKGANMLKSFNSIKRELYDF